MTFKQWLEVELQERGARTSLSANYPSLYSSKRQNPPNDWAPTSASVPVAIKNGLGAEKPCKEFNPKIEKKCGKQPQVKEGGPHTTSKSENPFKSFYATEGYYSRRKRGKGNDPTTYNKAVLRELERISPEHAAMLNQKGTALGWWDTIGYFRTQHVVPEEAAKRLAADPIPAQVERGAGPTPNWR